MGILCSYIQKKGSGDVVCRDDRLSLRIEEICSVGAVAIWLPNIADAPLCAGCVASEEVNCSFRASKKVTTCRVLKMIFAPSEESK